MDKRKILLISTPLICIALALFAFGLSAGNRYISKLKKEKAQQNADAYNGEAADGASYSYNGEAVDGDSYSNAGRTEDEDATSGWENSELNIIDDKYRNYYEIFVYSFRDSDGDGIGDLNGVNEELGYIKELGCNGIWLMPVMSSGTYHKYDVTDYMSIDPEYGTMEDFERLIDDAHKNDINVIIDFVMNHTSSKHEWFIKACEYLAEHASDGRSLNEMALECPYVGYYHFSKEKLSDTYYQVPGTDFYYEGEFWSKMPDLNFASEELWQEFKSIISFWIDKGVDGFRMDAAMHFEEGDTGFNTEVLARVYEYATAIDPDFYMVSEVWAGEKTIASYYSSQTDSMFNFDAAGPEGILLGAVRGNVKASRLVSAMQGYEDDFKSANPEYIDAPFLTNHDMGRVANALNGDENAIKFAGGLLGSQSGSIFIYYGEEIGMKSSGTKDENKRLAMPWGTDKGVCKGPLDADPGIESDFGPVSEQVSDPDSIYNYYRHVLNIRNRYPEIARGSITVLAEMTDGNKAVMIKSYNSERISIIYNNSKTESVSVTSADIAGIGKALDVTECSMVDYLTVNDEKIVFNADGFQMPARSIVYIK